VLVLDLDAQGSASAWLGADARPGVGVLEVLTGRAALAAAVVPSSTMPGVDVLPASGELAAADKALAGDALAVLGLRRALEAARPDAYAWAIIDTPPALGTLTTAGIVAARWVVVTAEASAWGLAGVAETVRTVNEAERLVEQGLVTVNGARAMLEAVGAVGPAVLGVLPCRVAPRQRLAAAALAALRTAYGDAVTGSSIRESVRLREAAAARLPVTLYDPTGTGAADYAAAAAELNGRIHHATQNAV
jgi:chromosome partitioning protein